MEKTSFSLAWMAEIYLDNVRNISKIFTPISTIVLIILTYL